MSRLLLLFWFMCISMPAGAGPFSLSLEKDHRISLETFGAAPMRQSSANPLKADLRGTEESECRPYGRASAAQAQAQVERVAQSDDGLSFTMKVDANANGGHYRSCAQCLLGNCVGIFGNDTRGQASASVASRVVVKFAADADSSDFLIIAQSTSTGSTPVLRFVDGVGKSVPESALREGVVVKATPGATYYIESALDANARDQGGCCNAEQHLLARVDVRVAKAPILAVRGKIEPYIVGGEQTLGFAEVGALLLDGRLHCTATVVGPSTLLTAAHCLHGYEGQTSKMTFVQGRNVLQPDGAPVTVIDFAYPKGVPSGFSYNPKTFEDDIGLVYLEQPVGTQPVPLHGGSPTWEDIKDKKLSLTFVGFGYDVVDEQKFGSGIKREASWGIDTVENRRVLFRVPGKNTCKGDSGGPAFYPIAGKRVQLAVTSGGDLDCTTGFETRVDAFLPWLVGRIR